MKRVSFQMVEEAAESADLQFRRCSKYHAQVLGGIVVVNVYVRNSGKMVLHVQGTAGSRQVRSPGQVIDAAVGVTNYGHSRADRKKRYDGVKRRKWNQQSRGGGSVLCHWCKEPFESIRATTIDHVIPLSRGGSNSDDNLVLACSPCNSDRGNRVNAEELKSINPQLKGPQ